jgi:hypothetical protein
MRLRLQSGTSPGSRVLIDLRATGLLKAVAHDPTLTARPDRVAVELEGAAPPGDGTIAARVEATFRVHAIEAPQDIPRGDRDQMVENLRGREVLDAARFPTIDFRGRYSGTLEAGTLAGDLAIRGGARPLSLPVRATREGPELAATATWEGRLTDLGVKPFKALLGAIKLEDWIRLRLELRFAVDEP